MGMARATRRTLVRRALAMLIASGLAILGLAVGVAPASASNPPVIVGVVQDATSGQGVAGLTVQLFAASDQGTPVQTTSTNGVGAYVFTNVSDGAYVVEIPDGQGYAPTSATTTVSGSNVSMPNLYVNHYGTLSGTVTNYDGKSAINVIANYWTGSTWTTSGRPSTVNADGSWSLNAVAAAGEYSITFDIGSYAVPYFTTFYGNRVSIPNPAESLAGVITASASQSIGNLSVTMSEAGYITGKATSGAHPAVGVNVAAYDNLTFNTYNAFAPTSSTGMYSIKVPAGVDLEVATDGAVPYAQQAWKGHDDDECGCNTYDPVSVAFGETHSGINFALVEDPVEIVTNGVIDDGSPFGEPVANGYADLYRQVTGGYSLVKSDALDDTGTSDVVLSSGGNLRVRISVVNPTTHKVTWLAIEGYDLFNSTDSTIPDPVFPASPVCSVNLPTLHAGDLEFVGLELVPSSSCGPEPSVKKPVGSAPDFFGGTTSVASSVTSTPTPTPTPTPTATPAPTSTPEPSASSTPTPRPTPTASSGGLPWWVWVLIVLGVLVLIGLGVVVFRVRS